MNEIIFNVIQTEPNWTVRAIDTITLRQSSFTVQELAEVPHAIRHTSNAMTMNREKDLIEIRSLILSENDPYRLAIKVNDILTRKENS